MSGEFLSDEQQRQAGAARQLPTSDSGSRFAAGARFPGAGRVIGGRNRSTIEQNYAQNTATDLRAPLDIHTNSGVTNYNASNPEVTPPTSQGK
jgi:hypothetical protein